MSNCIKVERTNLIKREEILRNAVYGIENKVEEQKIIHKVVQPVEEAKVYM